MTIGETQKSIDSFKSSLSLIEGIRQGTKVPRYGSEAGVFLGSTQNSLDYGDSEIFKKQKKMINNLFSKNISRSQLYLSDHQRSQSQKS